MSFKNYESILKIETDEEEQTEKNKSERFSATRLILITILEN